MRTLKVNTSLLIRHPIIQMTVAQQTRTYTRTASAFLVNVEADTRQVRQANKSVPEGQESVFLQYHTTWGPLFFGQQRGRDKCQLLPLGAKRRTALDPTGETQSHRTVKDATPPKGLGQSRHLATDEDPARAGSFRLQNVIALMNQALPKRIQPSIALTARDRNVDLLRQPAGLRKSSRANGSSSQYALCFSSPRAMRSAVS